MTTKQAACLESLRHLLASAKRITAAAEAGDWDTVLRERAANETGFSDLQRELSAAIPVLSAAERAAANALIREIRETNERALQIITPRQQDIRLLLDALAS